MAPPLHFLVNPAAGGGRGGNRWPALHAQARALGLDGPITVSTRPGHLRHAASSIASAGNGSVLVAVGGDGTVLEVADGIREAKVPIASAVLGILPLGSGNDAARMAGIRDARQALTALADGRHRDFDTVEVECRSDAGQCRRHALVFAGAGLAADILERTPPHWKRVLGGRFGYIAGFFRALARHRPYPMRLRADGAVCEGHFAAVVAANHTHAGGHTMHIAPGAHPDDGHLDFSLIHGVGRIAAARQFLRLVRGDHIHHPAVRYFRGQCLELDAPVPVPIQADGECLGTTPAVFRLHPASLRIAVPRA